MMEVAVAVQLAGTAFKGITDALKQGKEIHQTMHYFTQFYEAKDAVMDQGIDHDNSSGALKFFKGKSVEAEALRITQAKHRFAEMEKQLREFLIYSGQTDFYEDMMSERRRIRLAKSQAKLRAARKKAFMIDMIALIGFFVVSGFIIAATVSLVSSGM